MEWWTKSYWGLRCNQIFIFVCWLLSRVWMMPWKRPLLAQSNNFLYIYVYAMANGPNTKTMKMSEGKSIQFTHFDSVWLKNQNIIEIQSSECIFIFIHNSQVALIKDVGAFMATVENEPIYAMDLWEHMEHTHTHTTHTNIWWFLCENCNEHFCGFALCFIKSFQHIRPHRSL